MLHLDRGARTTVHSAHRSSMRTVLALAIAAAWLAPAACTRDNGTGLSSESDVNITLDATSVQLLQQDTKQITATVTGTPNTAVVWSSATPSIATVSSTGLVTAVAGGETSITATSVADPSKNASIPVVVTFRVNLAQTPAAAELYVSGTLPGASATTKLTATVTGSANTKVTWTSSNPAVATVDQTGLVTAVGGTPAPDGSAPTVTISSAAAADPTRTAASLVTVFPAPTSGIAVANGTSVANLTGATGDLSLFRIYIPPDIANVTVTTRGGSGDLDLFIRRGLPIVRPPLTSADKARFACVSEGLDTNETCSIANPPPGYYYIQIVAFERYSGVAFVVKTTP